MAENPALHKYDVVKRITILSTFLAQAGYSSFNEIQTFLRFPEVNFFSGNHHRQGQYSHVFFLLGWSSGLHIFCPRATGCYTTFRGRDILHDVTVSGYVTFYQINKFLQRYNFFIIGKMSSQARFGPWNIVLRPLG